MTDHPMLRVGGPGHCCREELIRPVLAQGCIDLDRLGVLLPVDVLPGTLPPSEPRIIAGDIEPPCIHLWH